MKTISGVPYALSVCAAAAMLAGCGGATQFPNPAAQTPRGNTGTVDRSASPSIVSSNRPDSGRGKVERLSASTVQVGKCGGDGFEFSCNFSARGRAVGPYPGTFFARNKERSSCGTFGGKFFCGWSFNEHFVITSGASNILGNINANGPGPLLGIHQYTTKNGYSGNVKIQSLGGVFSSGGDFSEIFHGM